MTTQFALDFTKPLTLHDRYEAFKAANPHIFGILEDRIDFMVARGATRIGIAQVVEELRWDKQYLINRGHEAFKINNSFRAFYATEILERNPQWKDIIEVRARKAL
jgi:hypothetical protein